MTNYTAYFRTDAYWASKAFTAKTPKQALATGRAFFEAHDGDLLFQEHGGGSPINEIEVAGPDGLGLAVWRNGPSRQCRNASESSD
jgi:hypothetical protein